MNWDVMQGKWKQIEGGARSEWGKFSDDEWHHVGGDFEKFVGKIQDKYGLSRQEAETKAHDWANRHAGSTGTGNQTANTNEHTNPSR